MQTVRSKSEKLSFEFPVTADDEFHGISSARGIIKAVIKFADPFICHTNKYILVQEDEPHYFYYLEKGRVEVSYTEEETKIVVALIGEGSFFGEVGFFDNSSRVRDIRAIEDSVIRRFSAETLSRIEEEDPSLSNKHESLQDHNPSHHHNRLLS